MENKRIIIGNMKMNMTASEVCNYLKEIDGKINSEQVILCPTSIYIPYFLKKPFKVGLQNVYFHDAGAYTGEVSPKQASSMGIRLTLVGHSERRLHLNESDDLIRSKIVDALRNHLVVVLCIGETKEERDMLRTDKVLKKQLKGALKGLEPNSLDHIMIAYEPVWAIGSNETPSNKEIHDTIAYLKTLIEKEFDYPDISVLYGGSVNDKNIEDLNKIDNLSGYLVGGASLEVKKLLKIIEVVVNQ